MRNLSIILVIGSAVLVGACATGGERTGTSRNVLEAEEIQEAGPHLRTAYDAVEQLRPQFLRVRPNPTVGARTADPVRVYVNGTLWGGPEALHRLRAEEVVRIRFIRPTDAQTRFGMNHGSGALDVSTTGR